MAEIKVVLKNESTNQENGGSQNATSTSEQQKITQTKKQAESDRAKTIGKVGTVALSIANSSVGLYTQYSNTQASLEGNSAYSERVAFNNQMLQKGVSVGGSFVLATAMTGNVAIGGVAAIISFGTNIASTIMEAKQTDVANSIVRNTQVLSAYRLGSAANFWRK